MIHYQDYKYVLINENINKTVNQLIKIIEFNLYIQSNRKTKSILKKRRDSRDTPLDQKPTSLHRNLLNITQSSIIITPHHLTITLYTLTKVAFKFRIIANPHRNF